MSGSLSSVEGELNAIVKEYLEHLRLGNSVHAFEEECQKLGKPIQDNAGGCRQDERISKIQNELLHYFDRGERLEFFSAWETHISAAIRDRDMYCQKLELNLHVHFAVFPLRKKDHWVKDEVEDAMFHFRYYLETKGSVLSQCAELLPYYALPYVPSPSTHPSFKDLFVDSWVLTLRNRLETFLWEHLKEKFQIPQQPRLVELVWKKFFFSADVREELKSTEKHLEESEKRCVLQAKKLEKLQEDCQQLMTVASLLVTALESAVKGDMVDMDYVLTTCTEHFPDAFKLRENNEQSESLPLSRENLQSTAIETAKTKYCDNHTSSQAQSSQIDFILDFTKVKEDIINSDTRTQMLLLQALRWRLTKSDSGKWRENMLLSYIENDLLGCDDSVAYQKKVIEMMKTASEVLFQSLARFLNAFASFSKGRAYMSHCSHILHILQDALLENQPNDVLIRDMALGTLQKLSMRKVSQNSMIEADMIGWLINMINSPSNLTDYGLEYAAALLMNLCLCSSGKKKCELLKEQLVSVLGSLLELSNPEIIPYVNGTLYSILSVSSIRDYAKKQGFDETLQRISEKSMPEAQRQLECVLKLFSAETENEVCSSEEDNEDEEEVDLEPELDMNDPIEAEPGELSGEELLSSKYSLTPLTREESSISIHGHEESRESTITLRNPSAALDKESEKTIQLNCHSQAHSARNHDKNARSNSVPPQTNIVVAQSPYGQKSVSEPVTPKLDLEATQMVRKIVGQSSTTIVEAAIISNPASMNIKGLNVNEYTVAFSSRPKIPRTPELCPPTPPNRSQGEIGIGASGSMSPKVAASSPPHNASVSNAYTSALKSAIK